MVASIKYCMINGHILPENEAVIPVADRGLRFGDGAFETARVVHGVPYQWELHLRRLKEGLKALSIAYQARNLKEQALKLIAENQVKQGILRIMVTRGEGSIGYLPAKDCKPNVIIEAVQAGLKAPEPTKIWLSSVAKVSSRSLPVQYKLMQGVNSVLAKIEADKHGCKEALLLNEQGILCEGSSGNIFWVKDGVLFTPSLECGVLAGTMRQAVLRLADLPVIEGSFPVHALEDAEEVFLTNATWPIMPVSTILPLKLQYKSYKVAQALTKVLYQDMDAYAKTWNV